MNYGYSGYNVMPPLPPYQPYSFQYQKTTLPNGTGQFIVHQVTGVDEAKAAIIDAFNTHLFIDMAAGKIYLKRINNNGLSDFMTFTGDVQAVPDSTDPITEIKTRIDSIERQIKEMKDVQSLSGDDATKPFNAKNENAKSYAVRQGQPNDNGQNRPRN